MNLSRFFGSRLRWTSAISRCRLMLSWAWRSAGLRRYHLLLELLVYLRNTGFSFCIHILSQHEYRPGLQLTKLLLQLGP